MGILLAVWAFVSFGLGIVLVEPLNRFHLGGFPLGFWFAQQGSIYVFVVLILVYAVWMDRVDRRHGAGEQPDAP
jgi:putative solute:sodium symporter small subunit